jgi:hypothetical protein
MKRLRFAEQWNSWAQLLLPPAAPAIQRQALRMAFYSGAFALYRTAREAGVSGHFPPTALDLETARGLIEELEDFRNNLHIEVPAAFRTDTTQ